MKALKFLVIFLLLSNVVTAQLDYKYDNVVYKTLYPKDLSKFLSAHKDAILIDVRTPGEYQDTSQFGSLNIGRLKGARNIEIDTLKSQIPTLVKFKNKPVILYCSHSQRSRRGSKLLKENGFTQVYNLNGGMTWMNQANEVEFPNKNKLIVHNLPHKTIDVDETIDLIKKTKDILIIDVRSAVEFESRDSLQINNLGRIKNAINIPRDVIKDRLNSLEAYKKKPILVYDYNGALSNHVAKYLTENGFKKVYNLTGGIFAIIGKEKNAVSNKNFLLTDTPKYGLLNSKEALELIKAKKDLIIIDTRTQEEYDNKSERVWRNLGRLKNAKHFEATTFDANSPDLIKYKNNTILVYGSDSQAANCSKKLTDAGYTNVNVLFGGLWSMISSSANDKQFGNIKPYMENYEGLY